MIYRTSVTALITFALLIFLTSLTFPRDDGEELFGETLKLYKSLTVDSKKIENREIWDTIAQAFYSIYLQYPDSPKASESLFLSGKMYEEMGQRFNNDRDFEKSVKRSRQFIEAFPNSDMADDAQIRNARIIEGWNKSDAYVEYEKVIDNFPDGDMIYAARNKVEELALFKPVTKKLSTDKKDTSHLIKVSKIRHWSTDTYTRVVIHVDKEMPFNHYFLKADPSIGKPPRLYVDISGTKVDPNLEVETIKGGLLEQIKFARNTLNKVRVVLYINSFDKYRVFSLNDPFRIVMDIEGEQTGAVASQESQPREKGSGSLSNLPPPDASTLRQALGLKIRTVVIDPGHGGHDPGAIGPTGLKEKDINLDIAKALKTKLEQAGESLGISRVILTRSNDRFIPLEERTAIAKQHSADLFISVHCNAAKSSNAYGIETYILSFTDDPRALAVAARENSTTTKRVSDLKDIIQKYLLSSKIEESQRFANHVQSSVISTVGGKYKPVKNKGVKKAPFIVLIGADVPSILVESSFITNPREEKRLRSKKYRDEIAEGIFSGIKRYTSEVETAFLER